MAHTALLEIFKVNDVKSGQKDGRPWELQDAECALLTEGLTIEQVGVLSIPRDLRGKVQPGRYTGAFTLRADLRTRRIEAVLVGLTPLPPVKPAAPAAPAVKA